MSNALQGRIAIKARQIKPGEAYAVEVLAGQFVQITDVAGKQVADFVAFNTADRAEHLSVAATRTTGGSIMLQTGMKLVSNRRNPMFELTDDSVGRHDMLYAPCDHSRDNGATTGGATTAEPIAPVEQAEPIVANEEVEVTESGTAEATVAPAEPVASTEPAELPAYRSALSEALRAFGIGFDQIPDPVNWFMNVGIKQRGELEVREPLSERNDYVVLTALMDSVIAVSACSPDGDAANGAHPSDILVRVYR